MLFFLKKITQSLAIPFFQVSNLLKNPTFVHSPVRSGLLIVSVFLVHLQEGY